MSTRRLQQFVSVIDGESLPTRDIVPGMKALFYPSGNKWQHSGERWVAGWTSDAGSVISATGLEKVSNTGWRLLGVEELNYGTIGANAVDLSISTTVPGNKGATGQYANAEGLNTTSSGKASHAEGVRTKATGDYAHAEGAYTFAIGDESHAGGSGTRAEGRYSFAVGHDTVAKLSGSAVFGRYNVGFTNTIHEIGIGSLAAKANGIEVFDTGVIVAPNLTIDKINDVVNTPNADVDKILVTKEWVLAHAGIPTDEISLGTAANYTVINEKGVEMFGEAEQFKDITFNFIGRKIANNTGTVDMGWTKNAMRFQKNGSLSVINNRVQGSETYNHEFRTSKSLTDLIPLEMHFHWHQYNTTDKFDVALMYRITNNRQSHKEDQSDWTTINVTTNDGHEAYPFNLDAGDDYMMQITSFAIQNVYVTLSAEIEMMFTRTDNTTFRKLYVKRFDIHAPVNRFGSNEPHSD